MTKEKIEELKSENFTLKVLNTQQDELINQLKQENEKLKVKAEKLDSLNRIFNVNVEDKDNKKDIYFSVVNLLQENEELKDFIFYNFGFSKHGTYFRYPSPVNEEAIKKVVEND